MRLLTLSCCLACAMSPLCRADDVPSSATAPGSALHASEKLAKPISIKTRLRNGARVNGKVTSFDGEGFEGDASTGEGFSKTLWCDILPADLAALATESSAAGIARP